MIWLVFLCVAIIATSVGINFYSAYVLRKPEPVPAPALPLNLPKVAVLVACRNEEASVDACLQSLLALNYPTENLQIFLGNDDSEDDTGRLLEGYARQYSHIYYLPISERWGLAQGKANALAQLARQALPRAEYLFITDADVRVNPLWIQGLLMNFTPQTGMVSGFTLPAGSTLGAAYQRLDWLTALGWAKAYSLIPRIGRPLTAIGNNMAVSASAYLATGGYERIPFSVTEDYALKLQLEKLGYRSAQVISAESRAQTLLLASISQLLQQRRRWLSGAVKLPAGMLFLLLIQSLSFSGVVGLFWWYWPAGLAALGIKWLSLKYMAHWVQKKAGISQKSPFYVGYEVYSALLNLGTLVYYLLPLPVIWKNRTYR